MEASLTELKTQIKKLRHTIEEQGRQIKLKDNLIIVIKAKKLEVEKKNEELIEINKKLQSE
ncbi:hypothetical protein KQX54_000258, partial [Cotesia glomerata]